MNGKKYNGIKAKVPPQAIGVAEAITFLKDNAVRNFDEAVELHMRLGVDTSKSDQIVRGNLQLPSGAPSTKKIAVFTSDKVKQKEAKEAGAHIVGGEELVDTVAADGAIDAEAAIATPEMMPKLAKVARILGPKGLMPNPKIGTVTPDVTQAIKDLSGGKISFKADQLGNIHEAVGRISWDAEKTIANIEAMVEAVRAARPASAKGVFIKSITVCSTMSPGIHIVTK